MCWAFANIYGVLSLSVKTKVHLYLFLSRLVQTMDYSVIVFDTAPTGHTLRLLQFPSTLEKGLAKVMSLRNKFGGVISQVNPPPPEKASFSTFPPLSCYFYNGRIIWNVPEKMIHLHLPA